MYKDKKNGLYKLIMNVCKKNAVLPREWAIQYNLRETAVKYFKVFIKILHNFNKSAIALTITIFRICCCYNIYYIETIFFLLIEASLLMIEKGFSLRGILSKTLNRFFCKFGL